MIMFSPCPHSPAFKINLENIKKIQRTFSEYTLKGPSSNELIFSIYYPPSERLTGELHTDAKLLTGIKTLIECLKTDNIVKNDPTPVEGNNLYQTVLACDKQASGYKPEACGTLVNVALYENHIDLAMKAPDLPSFARQIKSYLHDLSLTAITPPTSCQARL